jgi:hypothetical protein
MPVYSVVIESGATGDDVIVPVVGTDGWVSTDQTPPVPTVYDTLVDSGDGKAATTTSCVGATCAPLGAHTLLCRPDKRQIVLDGAPAIDFFSLPAGFLLESLDIIAVRNQVLITSGATVEIFQDGFLVATYVITNGWPLATNVFEEVDVVPNSLYRAFNGQIKIVNTSTINGSLTINIDKISISGDYSIWSSQLTLASDGNKITITDGAGQLEELTDVQVSYLDPNTGEIFSFTGQIIFQNAFELIFIIPLFIPIYYQLLFTGIGNGVQFSGSVVLGSLNTLLTDGSGIYTLVPGKTSDTYYDRSTDPVTTIEIKIPDPFAKIGFIP